MLPEHFSIALLIAACALAMALSGCAAAPLTQTAGTQMAPQPACLPMSACHPDQLQVPLETYPAASANRFIS
jgi:hypothetical protein